MDTSAPFGFNPSWHSTGLERAIPFQITSGYGTAMYKFQPVVLNTNGTLQAATAAADFLGIFSGFQWIDTFGKPQFSPYFPAGQTGTAGSLIGWVWIDPEIVYDVQATGSIPLTAIGDQADVANVANGSTATGTSLCGLSATLAGAGVQGQFRIMGITPRPDNAVGDNFTIVQVKMARSQQYANKVAI